MDNKDIVQFNKNAWNQLVDKSNKWTVPVSKEKIQFAREGKWSVLLTPCKPVPDNWFPLMENLDILCLASAGGQQVPIFSAAGANVTSFDNSPRQLKQDQLVAKREGLNIRIIEGDMADLSLLNDNSFDLIFNPVSNCFAPDLEPIWKESYRVLRSRGTLLVGFVNPIEFTFDNDLAEKGVYQIRYSLPYSDLTSITEEDRIRYFGKDDPIEFSHTLETQIGGQLKAGFQLLDFYEDYREEEKIKDFIPSFIATRAIKVKKRS